MRKVEVNKYLTTTKEIVEEVKHLVSLFEHKEITQNVFEDIIADYFNEYQNFIVDEKDGVLELKASVKQKLGQKRMRLITKALEEKDLVEVLASHTMKQLN